ncbi:MAG: DUF6495 family protein [Bacteroidota bacterium]
MKYSRLTKEQFEELEQEFINFLATQSITADEWKDIKANNPEVAEEELDVFSDLIWEGVLSKVKYLEHISKRQMHLFHFEKKEIRLISLKINREDIDITTKKGYDWFRSNLLSDEIEFFTAKKEYSKDKGSDKFKFIQEGANITKGELFRYFEDLVSK